MALTSECHLQREVTSCLQRIIYTSLNDHNFVSCKDYPFKFSVILHKSYSPVEKQNDLELDFKVYFFVETCC